MKHFMKSARRTWCKRKVPKDAKPRASSSREKECRLCLRAIYASRPRARRPVPRRNEKRARERFKKDYGTQGAMAHRSPCYACTRGCDREPDEQETQAAHVKRSRGAGGASGAIVPMCARCHAYQHNHGAAALEEKYGLKPGAFEREADRLADLVTRARRGERHGE